MRITEHNKEVFFAADKFVEVDSNFLETLKDKSRSNKNGKIRLCTHKENSDPIHEMLIVHSKKTYVRPHKHLNKIETFHVIEGKADVVIFDENGGIKKLVSLGDYASKSVFYWKMSEAYYHTVLINSEFFIFHEITNGPFNKNDVIFPSWAPEGNNEAAQKAYLKNLRLSVEAYKGKESQGG